MKRQSPKKCRVLVPVARRLDEPTEDALGVLVERGYDVKLLKGCSEISLARNALASRAFEDGFEETMWIDADVSFNPDQVEQLRNLQVPMSAGLYVKRDRKSFAAEFFQQDKAATFGVGGGCLPIKRVGMGFTHIRREVYETTLRQLKLPRCKGHYNPLQWVYPWFQPMVVQDGENQLYLCEDAAFCERAALCGFAIIADTRIRLGHGADTVLTWDDLAPKRMYATVNVKASDKPDAPVYAEADLPVSEKETSMNEAQLYERLGRLQVNLDFVNNAYDELLNALAKVITGEIPRESVLVNLTARSWKWENDGSPACMPATFNGLPVCVAGKPIEASEVKLVSTPPIEAKEAA